MIAALGSVAGKALMSMGMKLLAKEVIEDLILWLLKKWAQNSEAKWDDELVKMVEEHLSK